ncbi:histone-lysine N-methyltransferase SETMAR isoform 2-T2 [Discoglossus pictus]
MSLHYYKTCLPYTPELIAGPGAEEDPSEVTIRGCDCRGPRCDPQTCTCLPYGDNYLQSSIVSSQRPVLECHTLCRCGDSCPNRETQRGLQFQLQVYKTSGKGWGVRTLEPIARGRFVCEYVGEVLGQDEAYRRIQCQDPHANNYIIAVREHLHGGQTLQTFVDPTYKGNVGRFLNHSCQPNLFMVPVRTHSMVPRLALFAARDIIPGEELCYDYSGRFCNPDPDSARGSQATEPGETGSGKRCLCGAPICSSVLPYEHSLYQCESK